MSTRELRRAEALGRVKGQTLRLVDAAKMLELSYRQAKRLWQRYRAEGAKGLQHRSAGTVLGRGDLDSHGFRLANFHVVLLCAHGLAFPLVVFQLIPIGSDWFSVNPNRLPPTSCRVNHKFPLFGNRLKRPIPAFE